MFRPTHCITITLATLAIAVPSASAMVVDPVSSTGTPAPAQDLRNPDQRAPAQSVADMHASTAIAAQQAKRSVSNPADDGVSPLVYVLPSAALLALLGATTGVAVATGRFPRSHARA